jgi:hypothetical protein
VLRRREPPFIDFPFSRLSPSTSAQSYELKLYAGYNPFLMVSFLKEYVGSEIYIWQVRIIGVCCLLAAGALFYALLPWPPDTLAVIGS